MTSDLTIGPGRAAPLGATPEEGGVNFAVFSENATRMQVCLFSDDGQTEMQRIDLPERDGDVWHGHVTGLTPGQLYGLRAHGPWRPEDGHRFNPDKLLIDPYAKRLTGHPAWHDALMGHTEGKVDEVRDPRDSAPYMPRCVVEAPAPYTGTPPGTAMEDSVIYEAHVKGLTAMRKDVEHPGTFLAMASDPMLDHLTDLGITAIELLPAQAFLTDRFLHDKGLVNYWGYQTLGFFAPEPKYLAHGQIAEFQQMVRRFHGAGIEVLMDVVYNHTCEGDERGPTLAFRGLDNSSYYRLEPDRRHYVNDTGTGNTVNVEHPMVLRMVMDSLRYWVEVMGVDGFRFDLAPVLGRAGDGGFDRGAAFFDCIRQDPVLGQVKLIAEPWDIGPGGYQLGAFPPPFHEWNDRFRDRVRRFWRGDTGQLPALADRLTGSARQFDHSGRPATASLNLITAHDGFTLMDVVSYKARRNKANGEDGKDGHGQNYSDDMGHAGPTDDPAIVAARAQRRRNMLATLMLAQGTPMLLAGDEIGNTQGGNNNAYSQDNPTAWIDWEAAEWDMRDVVRDLIAFRNAHPILRQKRFLHARERALDGLEDLFWRRPDGQPMDTADWQDDSLSCLAVELRTASGTPAYAATEAAIFAVFNAGEGRRIVLPDPPDGTVWACRLDTSRPGADPGGVAGREIDAPGDAVLAFVLEEA